MGVAPSAAMIADRSLRRSPASNRALVGLIWICFLLRGLFYSSVFPIWEGYDEWSHFAYVQHLLSHRQIPVASRSHISEELQQSFALTPMPWTFRRQSPFLSHDGYWKLSSEERAHRQNQLRMLSAELSRQEAPNAAFIYEAQQPPLYYGLLAMPLRVLQDSPLPNRILWLRWISILIASLYIPLGFGVARRVLQNEGKAIAVIALSAAMPELLIELSRVGNESLGLTIFTLLLLASLEYSAHPESARWAAVVGLILAAGLLTKAYFLTAVLPLLFAGAALYSGRTNKSVRLALNGAIALFIAAVIAVPWYWHNAVVTGSWTGLSNDIAINRLSLWSRLNAIPQVDWRNALDTIFFTHIWSGNWSSLSIRSWMYKPFLIFGLASLVGFVRLAFQFHRRGELIGRVDNSLIRSRGGWWFLAGIYGFFCLGVAYFTLLLFLDRGESSSPGWYFYVLVVPEVILVSGGLWQILPPPWSRRIVPIGMACFALLDLYAMHFVLIPYYTGLIFHRADGFLTAFHLGQLRDRSPWEILTRLAVNKPAFLGPPLLALLWVLYLVSTFVLIAVCVWTSSHPNRPASRMLR